MVMADATNPPIVARAMRPLNFLLPLICMHAAAMYKIRKAQSVGSFYAAVGRINCPQRWSRNPTRKCDPPTGRDWRRWGSPAYNSREHLGSRRAGSSRTKLEIYLYHQCEPEPNKESNGIKSANPTQRCWHRGEKANTQKCYAPLNEPFSLQTTVPIVAATATRNNSCTRRRVKKSYPLRMKFPRMPSREPKSRGVAG